MNGKQSGQYKMMFILLKYQCIVCKIDSKTNQKFMSIFSLDSNVSIFQCIF